MLQAPVSSRVGGSLRTVIPRVFVPPLSRSLPRAAYAAARCWAAAAPSRRMVVAFPPRPVGRAGARHESILVGVLVAESAARRVVAAHAVAHEVAHKVEMTA